ncbi:glycosyltransferase family 4 protein [Belliella kenyensis]|uniref:Glycosyltransferase family 4 protein n=1 Tax=Belliella kenyensis TaxID=1472724 RepID=A0ABV8EJK7_9BACT|nr:glycosyltransferase family 4 protein [Belliella kenyensis]MCH7402639.1 glycosyltransferase family 4 protein [Belliella kenyensis]MDN3603812.1 glycosyltransferase family 4 protein [Belliella kenyensis]
MKNSKPKILFILHVPPPVHGAAMMGKFLQDSSLINDTYECSFVNLSTSEKLNEIGQGGFNKVMRYFKLVYRVVHKAIKDKPNLIYMTPTSKGVGFYKDAFIALVLKLLGNNLVYHFHNKGVALNQHKLFDNFLYKLTFRNAKAILLSARLIFDIKKYFAKEDIFICPNGIPIIDFSPSEIENKPHMNILFLSNLLVSKGVYVLLEACQILKQLNLPFRCEMVGAEGDISAASLQEKISELNLHEQVVYLGKKYGEEKYALFSKSDIFVLPTYDEAFPLVLLEAMQFALPIVSSDVGGIGDMVTSHQNGFVTQPGDAQKVAEHLAFLIGDENEARRMGKNGREKFFASYTLEKFEQSMNSIFSDLTK